MDTNSTLSSPAALISIKWATLNFAAALTERESRGDRFEVVSGRGFFKVVKIIGSSRYAAAFVRKEDGQVFRAGGWSRKGRDLGFTIDQASAAKSLSTGEPGRA